MCDFCVCMHLCVHVDFRWLGLSSVISVYRLRLGFFLALKQYNINENPMDKGLSVSVLFCVSRHVAGVFVHAGMGTCACACVCVWLGG